MCLWVRAGAGASDAGNRLISAFRFGKRRGARVKERSAPAGGKRAARVTARPPATRRIEQPPAAEQTKTRKPRAPARLAAEVARLSAELEASQALVSELKTRIDVDPLTELLNRRGF